MDFDYCVLSFASTHAAISTHKHLTAHFSVALMPTLREISMGCGISVRFAPELLDAVRAELDAFGLEKSVYAIYGITMDDGQCRAQPISSGI